MVTTWASLNPKSMDTKRRKGVEKGESQGGCARFATMRNGFGREILTHVVCAMRELSACSRERRFPDIFGREISPRDDMLGQLV